MQTSSLISCRSGQKSYSVACSTMVTVPAACSVLVIHMPWNRLCHGSRSADYDAALSTHREMLESGTIVLQLCSGCSHALTIRDMERMSVLETADSHYNGHERNRDLSPVESMLAAWIISGWPTMRSQPPQDFETLCLPRCFSTSNLRFYPVSSFATSNIANQYPT